MEFTKENWENAPEGARLKCQVNLNQWEEVYFIGFLRSGNPAVETKDCHVLRPHETNLRIILPKRKVTVQLWRMGSGQLTAAYVDEKRWCAGADWTLLGEHTFEIEGE